MRSPKSAILRQELKGKIAWFIRLRWLAVPGLVLAIAVGRFLFHIPLALLPLSLCVAVLVGYNAAVHWVNRRLTRRLEEPEWLERAYRLASIQVFIDLALLTALLFFSGGLDNPFVFYYIFHMILSSILLTRRSAYLQASFAVALFALLSAAHQLGWMPAVAITGFGFSGPMSAATFSGRFIAFATTVYIAVYMTTSIVGTLRQREEELEVTNRMLAEQDRIKSRYVMTVSHDLQGSLSAIYSLLQTVLGGFTGEVGSQARELVQRAAARSKQLLRFVRDLLDVSRMRAETEVPMEVVPLAELVRAQVELLRASAQAKNVTLTAHIEDGTVSLWANRTAMEQLLANLLSNAIRYTPAGGKVTVSARPRPTARTAELEITDTGIGIPAESLPHIFDDFYRAANARSFAASGTGLGLSIVRRIVELHGGQIHVGSEVGKGTTFSLVLPLYRPSSPEGDPDTRRVNV